MKTTRSSTFPRRTLALLGLLVFTFTFIGLPSFTKFYMQTNVLDSIDVVTWMTRITDDASPELSTVEDSRVLLRRRGKVTPPRPSVVGSSMGVIDSSMGVVDSSMGVVDSSMGVIDSSMGVK